MKNQKELELLAVKNAPLPEGLEYPEQFLFLQLRSVYASYHTGQLSKEQAKNEKTNILEAYKTFELQYKIGQQNMAMLRSVQKYQGSIGESGCPVCKNLYRALCGLKVEEK